MYVNVAQLESLGLSISETYDDLVAMVPILQATSQVTVTMEANADWLILDCLFSTIAGWMISG